MNSKNLPASVRLLLCVVSALLCLALTVSSLAALAVANIRIITSKDNLQTIISQTLFSSAVPRRITPRLAAGGALSAPAAQTRTNPLRDAVVDALYNLIVDSSGNDLGVSRSQVEELLETSTVSDFLSQKIAAVISDIYTGEDTASLTRDEVSALLDENAAVIEDIFHVRADQKKIHEITDYVDRYNVMSTIKAEVNKAVGAPVLPTTPAAPTTTPAQTTPSQTGPVQTAPAPTGAPSDNVSEPSADTGESVTTSMPDATVPAAGSTPTNPILSVLNTLRTYTSVRALLIALIVCIVLAALLFLSNWGRPLVAAKWIGAALLAASIPFLLVTFAATISPDLLSGLSGWASVIGTLAAVALRLTLPVNLGVFAFAMILLIAAAIIGKVTKKKKAAL